MKIADNLQLEDFLEDEHRTNWLNEMCDDGDEELEENAAIRFEENWKMRHEKMNAESFCFNKNEFKADLLCAALQTHLNHTQLRAILDVLGKHLPSADLPKDPRTLLNTPRMLNIIKSDDNQSEYWHYGLEKSLLNVLRHCEIANESTISITVGIDGLPIYKSSRLEFWPILYTIEEYRKIIPPMCIGIYCGRGS